jgi:hypothetical protein
MADKARYERLAIALAIVIGGAWLRPVGAQDSERLTVEVDECVKLEKPEERLACFEAQVEAARRSPRSEPAAAPSAPPAVQSAPPAVQSAVPPVQSPPPAVQTPQPAPAASSAGNAGFPAERSGPTEIVAKIAELSETVPNAFLITLDNGQVWRQSQPMRYPLRPGLDVQLRPSKWGNDWHLTAPKLRGQIKVERVR